jgi:hypothetical protein
MDSAGNGSILVPAPGRPGGCGAASSIIAPAPRDEEDGQTMKELELNRDTVQFIIDTSHEFHERDEVTFPEEPASANADWSRQMASDFSADPYYGELKSTIDDLEPDQQVSLVALMWVGRGDYGLDEWDDAIAHAKDSWSEHTADYLIGTSLLADYLAEGLEIFDAWQSD